MKLNSVNYRPIADRLKCIDTLTELVENEDFSRCSMRETLGGDTNPHRETNIIVGVYDIIHNIDGVYDKAVMDKYDFCVDEVAEILRESYGYASIHIKSFCLIRLKAGDEIYEHFDDEYDDNDGTISTAYDYCHRVHIPIITNNSVVFTIGGEDRHLKQGELIEIDNVERHSVVNNGDTDRVHILIDFFGLDKCYDTLLSQIPDGFYLN